MRARRGRLNVQTLWGFRRDMVKANQPGAFLTDWLVIAGLFTFVGSDKRHSVNFGDVRIRPLI